MRMKFYAIGVFRQKRDVKHRSFTVADSSLKMILCLDLEAKSTYFHAHLSLWLAGAVSWDPPFVVESENGPIILITQELFADGF